MGRRGWGGKSGECPGRGEASRARGRGAGRGRRTRESGRAAGGGGRERWERRGPAASRPLLSLPSSLRHAPRPASRPRLPRRSSSRAGWNFFPWTGASCGAGGSQAAQGRAAGGAGAGAPRGGGRAAGSRARSGTAAPGTVGRRAEDGGDADAGVRPSDGAGGRRMASSRRPRGPGDPSLRRGSRGAVSLRMGVRWARGRHSGVPDSGGSQGPG